MYTAWRSSSELFLVLLLVGFGGVVVALLLVVRFFGWPDIGCSVSETQSFEAQADQG